MLYYNIYYFQIISYFFGFVLSQSLQNSQTLGQFFDPLYRQLMEAARSTRKHVKNDYRQ